MVCTWKKTDAQNGTVGQVRRSISQMSGESVILMQRSSRILMQWA